MENHWEAEILIYYHGIAHVLRELTPKAKERILSAMVRGKLCGPAYPDDFKLQQTDKTVSTEKA